MRKLMILIVAVFILCRCSLLDGDQKPANFPSDETVHLYCTPDLYDLLKNWSAEFCNANPAVKLEIVTTTQSSFYRTLFDTRALCFVSEEYTHLTGSRSTWSMVLAREIIVPVVNSQNPFLSDLQYRGISAESIKRLFSGDGNTGKNWGALTESGAHTPLHYYQVNKTSINALLAEFTGLNSLKTNGVSIKNGKKLIHAIESDPLSLGFCSMNDIYANSDLELATISILPIDRNQNGKVDRVEGFYNNIRELSRGVRIGKYPSSLVRSIYTISAGMPTDQTELRFLKWALTDGQQRLQTEGYTALLAGEIITKVNRLNEKPKVIETTVSQNAKAGRLFYIITSCLILVIILLSITNYNLRRKALIPDSPIQSPTVFDEGSLRAPSGLYYDRSHTWAIMEKDGLVKIGIDDFLPHITGPITGVKLIDNGKKVKKGDPVMSIVQEGKQINIHSPVSGKILAQNTDLITNPSHINTSPYTKGWVYMIKPSNWLMEIQLLIFDKEYKEWIRSEFYRFKDFLAMFVKPKDLKINQQVLQEGGELKDGILKDLGPEHWEDFQANFLDKDS